VREASSPTVDIRPALPSELALLGEIDDDAVQLYVQHGVAVALTREHPFARDELRRWLRSAELGRTFLAVDDADAGVGFAALDLLDGEPYLDQLSVRPSVMRRGIGSRLIGRSLEWARSAGGAFLWLTTYGHLSFNREYYEKRGFVVVPESDCGPGIRHHLAEQRRYLPAPDERVAMRCALGR
jgi:GNAT superfamily N-acetyltransferase